MGIRQQALKPGVFGFKLLDLPAVRDVHAAELATPAVIAGFREAMPAAKLANCQARLCFAQKANDLFFCNSLLLFQSPVIWDWTPESTATPMRWDVALIATNVGRQRTESHIHQCI